MSENLFRHRPQVLRADREHAGGHRGAVIRFTGLAGAGKSMLAHALERRLTALTAFVRPCRADRAMARDRIGARDFVEVHCDCPLEACEARDRKGIYRRARAGEVPGFTGISAPYEPPEAPDLVLDTAGSPIDVCLDRLEALLRARAILAGPG